jgi:hypothetical protein
MNQTLKYPNFKISTLNILKNKISVTCCPVESLSIGVWYHYDLQVRFAVCNQFSTLGNILLWEVTKVVHC